MPVIKRDAVVGGRSSVGGAGDPGPGGLEDGGLLSDALVFLEHEGQVLMLC